MLNISKLKKNNLKENIIINKKGEYVGNIKHYPAATKEWFNGIYAYNKNTIKSLPSADVYVTRLIKSYFNLFSKNFEKGARLNIIRFKRRPISLSRILVGKPEFKHTSDKVIITLFVYNREILKYTKRIKKMKGLKFLDKFFNKSQFIYKKKLDDKLKDKIIKYTFKNKMYIVKTIFSRFLKEIKSLNNKYLNTLNYSYFKIEKLPLINIIKDMLIKLRIYLRIKKLIFFNKSKFNSVLIYPLRYLLQKVYKKDVELNIISLKSYKLNSSILTQIMAKKLKNRNNRLIAVLDKVLSRIKMPFKKRLEYPSRKPKLLNMQNLIIRNNLKDNYIKVLPYVNLIDNKKLSNNTLTKVVYKKIREDKLDILLKSLYPKQYTLNILKNNRLSEKLRSLHNSVLDNLKNKIINGIRIEASGRLSKRLIASRAVFKMRQKGPIRNIHSSYRRMSAVLLRGQLTSNVDFSRSKNKTRIGAFGLKGWVSSL